MHLVELAHGQVTLDNMDGYGVDDKEDVSIAQNPCSDGVSGENGFRRQDLPSEDDLGSEDTSSVGIDFVRQKLAGEPARDAGGSGDSAEQFWSGRGERARPRAQCSEGKRRAVSSVMPACPRARHAPGMTGLRQG